MIHEIKGFLNKQDLENVNKMKDLMIKFDGKMSAGKFAASVKSSNTFHVPVILYPSDRLHRVRKISAGKRTVIIGWIYCLYPKPYNRYVICKSTKALHDLFDYIHHNKGKKKDLESAFNAFMLLNAQYKKLSLTNH